MLWVTHVQGCINAHMGTRDNRVTFVAVSATGNPSISSEPPSTGGLSLGPSPECLCMAAWAAAAAGRIPGTEAVQAKQCCHSCWSRDTKLLWYLSRWPGLPVYLQIDFSLWLSYSIMRWSKGWNSSELSSELIFIQWPCTWYLPGVCLSFLPWTQALDTHPTARCWCLLATKKMGEPCTARAAEGESLQHQDRSYWKWFQNMLNFPMISRTETLPSLPTTSPAVTRPIHLILDVENWNLGQKRGKQRPTATAHCKAIPPLASQQLQREHDRDKFCTVRGPAPLHQPKRAAAIHILAELSPRGLRASAAWARNEIKAIKRQEKR